MKIKTITTKLAHALGLVLAVVVINFTLLHVAPGDVADTIAGESGSGDPAIKEQIRAEYGLDDPFIVQLGGYVKRVATGDLGTSYYLNGEPVTSLIAARLWPTILLVVSALLFAIIIGVLIGVYTARRPTGRASQFATVFSLVGYSMPVFWTGFLLIMLFARNLGWFPVSLMRDPTLEGGLITRWLDVAHHLVLPALSLGLIYLAQYSRQARASMLEVLQSDFVRTARAKGVSERLVVYKHALRNALIPVVTVAGLQFGSMLSGALLVETVFAWPGLGRLAAEAVFQRDGPVLLGILVFSALLVVVMNLLTDVAYRIVDPRIRIGGTRQ